MFMYRASPQRQACTHSFARESDHLIVALKWDNAHGAKGMTRWWLTALHPAWTQCRENGIKRTRCKGPREKAENRLDADGNIEEQKRATDWTKYVTQTESKS